MSITSKRLLIAASLLVVAVAVWLVLGGGDAAPARESAPPSTSAGASASGPAPSPARHDVTSTTGAAPRSTTPATPARTGAPAAWGAAARELASLSRDGGAGAGAREAPRLPRTVEESGAPAPGGELTDKTGWDPAIMKSFNREFMPLASECIELAQDRRPDLEGMLAFQVNLAPGPGGDDQVVVAALTIRPDNQIDDPELFECIEQTSFSLEGLEAPHDFDITMPITPVRPG